MRWEPRERDAEEAALLHERYDSLGLRRFVTRSVVEAHGGAVREELSGRLKSTWLVIPS